MHISGLVDMEVLFYLAFHWVDTAGFIKKQYSEGESNL